MKSVTVLLSTYNGEKYLKEQIDSVLCQENIKVNLIVRDDGSTDKTLEILKKYSDEGKLKYTKGENIGYKKSFLTLAHDCIGTSDYYAFCDQDDYWEPNKLKCAIDKLESVENKYKLYFSSLNIVDENLNFIKLKCYDKLNINLWSAMCRYNISGCTMVFNEDLIKLISNNELLESKITPSHDSIIYKLCLSVGGNIIYDKNSYILYRQHGNNVTGNRQGIKKRLKTEFVDLKNHKSLIADLIYREYNDLITDESKDILKSIIMYKASLKNTFKLITNKNFRHYNTIININNCIKVLLRIY